MAQSDFYPKSIADEVEDADAQALPKVKHARNREGGSKEQSGALVWAIYIYALWKVKSLASGSSALLRTMTAYLTCCLLTWLKPKVVARPPTVALQVVRGRFARRGQGQICLTRSGADLLDAVKRRIKTRWWSKELPPPIAPHTPGIMTPSLGSRSCARARTVRTSTKDFLSHHSLHDTSNFLGSSLGALGRGARIAGESHRRCVAGGTKSTARAALLR